MNTPFAEQRNPDPAVNMYQSPYLFNGKELDEETSLYYYGARYMQPILSMWLSVDPLSDAKPNYNPYAYCSNNPITRIDPDGRNDGWYEDLTSNKMIFNPKINSQKELSDAGINGKYWGDTGIEINEKGSYNIYMADGNSFEHSGTTLQGVTVNGGQMSEHAKTMSNPIVQSIHQSQKDLIWGTAELSSYALNTIGDVATYTGTTAMAIPGAQGVGGALIGAGAAIGGVGTGIEMGLNAANGEWGKFAVNGVSLILTNRISKGIGKLNRYNEGEKYFLRGLSNTNFNISSAFTKMGIDIKNKKD